MDINTKLKQFFSEIGISQRQIADANDVEPSTVSQWLNGKRSIPLSLILWAIKEYKFNFESLLNDAEPTLIKENQAEYFSKEKMIENIMKDVEKTLRKNL